jgi:hypothetical protein
MAVSKNVHNKIVGYAKQMRVAASHENLECMDCYRDHINQFEGFVDAVKAFGFINEGEAELYKNQQFDKLTLI